MAYRLWLLNVAPAGTTLSTNNVLATDGAAASAVAGTTGAFTSSSAHPQSGGLGARLVPSGTITQQMRLPFAAGNARAALCMYHYADTLPGAVIDIIAVRHASGQLLRFRITTTGAIAIVSSSGGAVATSADGAWQPGRLNRFEAYWDNSGGSAAGSCTLAIFNGESTTPDVTLTASNANFGTATTVSIDIGSVNNASLIWEQFWDSVQMNDGATAFIGPLNTNAPPTVGLGANQNVAAGAAVTATAIATDSDGSVASYAWTVLGASSSATPALTNANTSTVSFTAPAAGNLVTLQCTVTDNQGATATATTEVRVPATAGVTRYPLAVNATGAAWTRAGGSSTDGAALADANDATYLESPALSSTESARRIRLQPSQAASAAQFVNRLWTDSGSGNSVVRLYEGTTLRQAWTHALTTTPTDFTDSWSSATISAITDWGNLYVEVGATA